MRALALCTLAWIGACAYDWDSFDPRLEARATASSSSGAGGSDGGAGGSTASSGGGGGVACGAGEQLCVSECVDVDSDPDHCGDCATACGAAEICVSGACQLPASCKELLAARPGLSDGSYQLLTGGVTAPFEAHCDMTIEGGGWTLVASAVDRSYFSGTRCQTFCDPTPATSCDEAPFTDGGEAGTVADMLTADHKSVAYDSVPFDEMLFVDSNGQYVSYDATGSSVLAWYPAGLENWVAQLTEAHATFSYPAKATNIDPMLNACGTLRVSFNVEDSDSQVGGSCHVSAKGPSWPSQNNGNCFWDDVAVHWTRYAFYQGNDTDYRLWLVR